MTPDGSTKKSTMTSAAVWVKLVIDGDDGYDSFPCTFTSGMNIIVHDLKKAVAMEYRFALTSLSIDAASLKVYPPGTNPVPDEGTESLSPYLLISDPGFPSGISGQTPLIVTAKNRQQQVSLLVPRCCCWRLLLYLLLQFIYNILFLTAVG
jgi:hypothetical protein